MTVTPGPDLDYSPAREGASAAAFSQMWRGQLVWWHLGLAALVLLSAGLAISARGPHLLGELACLAVLATAYAVWGRRGLGQRDLVAGWVYLSVAWAAFFVMVLLSSGDGAAWLLLFALFSQNWAILDRLPAAVMTVAMALGIAVVQVVQAPAVGEALGGIVLSLAITLVLSMALGLFIHRLVAEAESRATVIDELRRAQADLAAAERAQGVHAERERLSREIHDTLAQGFTSVVTLARATEAALARGDLTAVRERLALIESTAAENLSEARLIVAELTPGHLQSRTLAEALQRLVDAVSAESGMSGRLRVSGEPSGLPANSEVVLLRSAQEALANIRRHSLASTFEVELSYAGEAAVRLSVTDDGRGFEPGQPRSGYGLDGASARVADVAGTFGVDSRPGDGTRVHVEVPR